MSLTPEEYGIMYVERFFNTLSEGHLKRIIVRYQEIIDIEEDRFEPGVFPLQHRRAGQPRPYPHKFGPQYLANMKRGLEIATKVLNERFPEVGRNEGAK